LGNTVFPSECDLMAPFDTWHRHHYDFPPFPLSVGISKVVWTFLPFLAADWPWNAAVSPDETDHALSRLFLLGLFNCLPFLVARISAPPYPRVEETPRIVLDLRVLPAPSLAAPPFFELEFILFSPSLKWQPFFFFLPESPRPPFKVHTPEKLPLSADSASTPPQMKSPYQVENFQSRH